MEAKATAKFVRVSPRKAQMSMNLIRGKNAVEAEAILKYTPNKCAEEIVKVLRSAMANAENNLNLAREELVVTQAYANQGPSMKRIKPRARGSADRIVKRTSHLTVVVGNGRED